VQRREVVASYRVFRDDAAGTIAITKVTATSAPAAPKPHLVALCALLAAVGILGTRRSP
jgi:hypothetical protein